MHDQPLTEAATRPALGRVLGAAVGCVWFTAHGRLVPAVVVLVIGVIAAQLPIVVPTVDARVRRGERWLSHGLSTVVGTILLGAFEVIVVWPVALVSRVVGRSPLRDRIPASESGWWDRRQVAPFPKHPFGREAAAVRLRTRPDAPPRRRTWPARLAAGAVVLAVASAAVAVYRQRTAPPSSATGGYNPMRSAAMQGHPEQQAAFGEILRMASGISYTPFAEWAIPDFQGRYVHVQNGVRASSQPAAGRADALRVWFFGGSSVLGYGARDGFTIPSEFAKAAVQAGVPVQVENHGVPGFTIYQEALALDAALAKGPPPDLIVFYDGYNDVVVGMGRPFFDLPEGQPGHQLIPDFTELSQKQGQVFVPTGGSGTASRPAAPPAAPALRYDGTVKAYQRGQDLARAIAEHHHVPVVFAWQPTLYSRKPSAGEASVYKGTLFDGFLTNSWRTVYRQIERRLPSDVIDLSHAYDNAPPVFFDAVHTNELGARLSGVALLDRLLPQLRAQQVQRVTAGSGR